MEIGIVGYGQMGKFMASLLSPLFADIKCYDPKHNLEKEIKNPNVTFSTLKETCLCDIVFLFPPISEFRQCCQSISRLIQPEAIVVEGCSVMCYPIELMKSYLPKTVDLIACHPLFGPQSGKNGVVGMTIVSAPVRTKNIDLIESIYSKIGLNIVRLSPTEHDQIMAKTQAFEQIIGQLLVAMRVKKEKLSTPGFDLLINLNAMLKEDSVEMFNDIQRKNGFAKPVLGEIIRELNTINDNLYNDKSNISSVSNIATLGPTGTDSESAAKEIQKKLKINGDIVLLPSFKEAIKYASVNDSYVLIPSAYKEKDKDRDSKSWADINFYIEEETNLKLYTSFVLELKEICVAVNTDLDRQKKAGIHPAMEYYLEKYKTDCDIVFYDAKPIAVKDCSKGLVDICIGSIDEVKKYHNLKIVKSFSANMCWTLYK